MSNPKSECDARTNLQQKTFFSIRIYEVLIISAFFIFIYCIYHTGIVLWILSFSTIYMAYCNLVASNTENLPVDDKAVFITGCDSGFGLDIAKQLLAKEFIVFAGCLNTESDGAKELRDTGCSHLHIMKLDVTDEDSIKQCADIVQEICDNSGLWALVNNAGIDRFGNVEFTTMDMYKKVMDVNYFGTVRMTKSFLPFIRKAKGRILNVSSCGGRFATPNRAAYCPSKFAVEAFSDILRLETQCFGIRVCIIEPCHYGGATKILEAQKVFLDASLDQMWEFAPDDVRQAYGKNYLYHLRTFVDDGVQSSHTNTRPIVEAMYHAILSPSPKFRYLIGGGKSFIDINTVFTYMASVVPEAVMDFILRKCHLSGFPVQQRLEK